MAFCMQKKPFFSIIIPLYQTEPFLEECFLSIKDQTCQDYECIIVNDSSPGVNLKDDIWQDKHFSHQVDLQNINQSQQAEEITRQIFGKNNPKIQFYTIPNQGQGIAQQYALEKTKGQYLVVIDSDDFLAKDYLELAQKKILKNQQNKVLFGNLKVYKDGQTADFKTIQKHHPTENNLKNLLVFPNFSMTPINYFWDLEMIKKYNIKYRFKRRGHDSSFLFDCLLAHFETHKNMEFEPIDNFYFYRQREGQTTKKYGDLILFEHTTSYMQERCRDFFKVSFRHGLLAYLFLSRFNLYKFRLKTKNKLNIFFATFLSKFLTICAILIAGYKTEK